MAGHAVRVLVVDECPSNKEKSKKTDCHSVLLHLTVVPQMKVFQQLSSVGVIQRGVYAAILKRRIPNIVSGSSFR